MRKEVESRTSSCSKCVPLVHLFKRASLRLYECFEPLVNKPLVKMPPMRYFFGVVGYLLFLSFFFFLKYNKEMKLHLRLQVFYLISNLLANINKI